MANPFAIVRLIARSERPSLTADLPAVALPFWIRKGYDGMTFFGHVITHSQREAHAFNTRFDAMKNHEMIHLYQARSTHDSWLCFYAKYLGYWFSGLRYRRRLPNAAYLLNPFEMEAYAHMHDLNYLKPGGMATGWKRYAEMSLQERLQAYRKRQERLQAYSKRQGNVIDNISVSAF